MVDYQHRLKHLVYWLLLTDFPDDLKAFGIDKIHWVEPGKFRIGPYVIATNYRTGASPAAKPYDEIEVHLSPVVMPKGNEVWAAISGDILVVEGRPPEWGVGA